MEHAHEPAIMAGQMVSPDARDADANGAVAGAVHAKRALHGLSSGRRPKCERPVSISIGVEPF
jgi:hypothetical protein